MLLDIRVFHLTVTAHVPTLLSVEMIESERAFFCKKLVTRWLYISIVISCSAYKLCRIALPAPRQSKPREGFVTRLRIYRSFCPRCAAIGAYLDFGNRPCALPGESLNLIKAMSF